MPLGTLDRTPPPFFRQGPSAFSRLLFFASMAVFLMAADTRYAMTQPVRTAVAVVLHPIELGLLVPVNGLRALGDYFGGFAAAQRRMEQAEVRTTAQAERLLQYDAMQQENARLRALLGLRAQLTFTHHAAEVLYDAPDAYTRKVVIDRGAAQGIERGAPVIDDRGVLGQVTRVYPTSAEVALLSDRDAAITVVNTRNQLRGVAYGDPSTAGMELRFVAANADIQVGDTLVTSGLDGIFPGGLPVARVTRLDRRADSAFARILLSPVAPLDAIRHVLVLDPLAHQLPPRPEISASRDANALGTARPSRR